MNKFMLIFTIILSATISHANDGGIAAIKVNQIKMRETAFKNGHEVIVRKITKPSFVISFEGGEAEKLQKVLPSEVSVITSMHPEIAEAYAQSFKALGIYSKPSSAATPKALQISCSDATLSNSGDAVIKTGKTVCTITVMSNEDGQAEDLFGGMQNFDPKVCK